MPDVYRDNLQADAERLANGFRWTARGISPDRNAVRASLNSTLEVNTRWTLYAGYQPGAGSPRECGRKLFVLREDGKTGVFFRLYR